MTKGKVMKKSICISPFDDEIKTAAQAVYLLNAFRELGFVTRRSFMEVVSEKRPEYATVEGFNKLTAYWNSRVRSEEMNDVIDSVLSQLKSE